MTISLSTVFKLAVFLTLAYFASIAITSLNASFDSTVSKISAREAAIEQAVNQ